MNAGSGFFTSLTDRLLWFQLYYVVQIVVTSVFIAYYVYLAFKFRESCIKDDSAKPDGSGGDDVKSAFTGAFVFGFVMHSVNMTIGTFVEPVLRLMNHARSP